MLGCGIGYMNIELNSDVRNIELKDDDALCTNRIK